MGDERDGPRGGRRQPAARTGRFARRRDVGARIGPHSRDRYEWQLAGIDGFGLDDITMDQVVTTLHAFVAGSARAWVAEQERLALAETDLEWWLQTGAVLDEVMDGAKYPVSGRVGSAAGEDYGLGDAERSFRFGLELLAAGIASLADRDPSGA